tara:strand:+ start:350 stop:523 length:174 start_codon:yes stop_codon:yes gene_type:complete
VHGPSPQERRYHTAVVIDKRIFIFGGQYYDPQARWDRCRVAREILTSTTDPHAGSGE